MKIVRSTELKTTFVKRTEGSRTAFIKTDWKPRFKPTKHLHRVLRSIPLVYRSQIHLFPESNIIMLAHTANHLECFVAKLASFATKR